jgi:hypothetical protein
VPCEQKEPKKRKMWRCKEMIRKTKLWKNLENERSLLVWDGKCVGQRIQSYTLISAIWRQKKCVKHSYFHQGKCVTLHYISLKIDGVTHTSTIIHMILIRIFYFIVTYNGLHLVNLFFPSIVSTNSFHKAAQSRTCILL